MERVALALHGVLPGEGAVLQDDEHRVRLRVRGPDTFGDALAIALLSIVGGVVMTVGEDGVLQLASLLVAGFFAYRAIARWSGATQVDLEGGELRITRLGPPWPMSSARISAADVAQIGVVELAEQERRNVRKLRYALVARLRDGTKRVLATGCHTREPLEQAERAFERRLGIVDRPLHQMPSLPVRVGSYEELTRPEVDVYTLEPGLVVEVGLPRQIAGYRSAAAQRPWLRLRATRRRAWSDLWHLLVAPLFAAPVVVVALDGSRLGTGMSIVAALYLAVIALAGYTISSSVVRGIRSLLRLEIRDGRVRTAEVEHDAATIERVDLGGELGRWTVRAWGSGFELDLACDLADQGEARWLLSRVRDALGLEVAPIGASPPSVDAAAAAETEAAAEAEREAAAEAESESRTAARP